jgi:hypothetical protein
VTAARSRVGRQPAQSSDARGTLRIDNRIVIGFGRDICLGFGRWLSVQQWVRSRRWLRHRRNRGAAQGVGHQPDGAMLGPGGPVGGDIVGLALPAICLHAEQQGPEPRA